MTGVTAFVVFVPLLILVSSPSTVFVVGLGLLLLFVFGPFVYLLGGYVG